MEPLNHNILQNNEDFLTNFNQYKKYESLFKSAFEPKSILVVPILLPYYFPLKEELEISGFSSLSNHGYLFKFKVIERKETYNDDLFFLNNVLQNSVSLFVYVELCLISPNVVSYDDGNDYFKYLLQDLNRHLISFRATSFNTTIFPITRQRLSPFTFSRIFNTDNWDMYDQSFLSLHTKSFNDLVCNKIPLSINFFKKITEYTSVNMAAKTNPFLVSEMFAFDALRNYNDGYNIDAVISIGTSMESFVKSLYGLILKTEDNTDAEINKIIDNPNFKYINTVEQQLKKMLGISGDRNAVDEYGNYYQQSYLLRNKIVHSGYDAVRHETCDAIKYAMKFKDHLINAVLSKQNKYKDIVLELNDINCYIPMSITSLIFQNMLILEKIGDTEKFDEYFEGFVRIRNKWIKLDE